LSTPTCPACAAAVGAGDSRCWLCNKPLAADARAGDTTASRKDIATGWTFSLSTLMLIVTLFAVTLGIAGLDPLLGNDGLGLGLAIVFAMLITPAMVRTSLASVRRRREGRAMPFAEKLLVLLSSVGIMVATVAAACAAFCATCFGALFGSMAAGAPGYEPLFWGLWLGIPLGVVLGLLVTFLMLRWLWPRKER
jgi:hypothetical protein